MKLLTALAAVAIVGWAAGAHADATWTVNINVAEVGGSNTNLTLGVDPTGTAGVDAALNEVVQPPLPPAGNFDARWSANGGLLVNIISGTTANIASSTQGLSFQRAAAGNITVTWNAANVAARTTSAVLQDAFGGVLGVNVDMRTVGTATITNAAITSLNVIFTSVDPFVPPNHTQLVLAGGPVGNVNSGTTLTAFTVTPQTAIGGASATAVSITASATGAGTLSGTLTANAAAGGAATFNALVYTAAAAPGNNETFTVTFTANDLNGTPITVTSANITSVVPNITSVLVAGGPTANVSSGVALAPAYTVTPRDGSNNPWTSAVNVTASLASGVGTFSGTTTVASAAGGPATFSNLIYTTNPGSTPGGTENFTITFTVTDLNGAPVTATTAAVTADVPLLIAPTLTPVAAAVAGGNINKAPLLQWSAVGPATGYFLNLGVQPACTSVLSNVAVAGTSYQVPTNLADGNYCWQVSSTDGTTTTAFSVSSTFATIPTFGDWGVILLVVSMVGVGGFFMRRRVAA